jgi:hypothetical protein
MHPANNYYVSSPMKRKRKRKRKEKKKEKDVREGETSTCGKFLFRAVHETRFLRAGEGPKNTKAKKSCDALWCTKGSITNVKSEFSKEYSPYYHKPIIYIIYKLPNCQTPFQYSITNQYQCYSYIFLK